MRCRGLWWPASGIKMTHTSDWPATLYKNDTAEQRSTLGVHLIATPACLCRGVHLTDSDPCLRDLLKERRTVSMKINIQKSTVDVTPVCTKESSNCFDTYREPALTKKNQNKYLKNSKNSNFCV